MVILSLVNQARKHQTSYSWRRVHLPLAAQALIVVETFRIAMMMTSFPSPAYLHHGSGALSATHAMATCHLGV